MRNLVAVEKLLGAEIGKIKIALGSPTSDFLNFQDSLYPPNFGSLREKWSFSTATSWVIRSGSVPSAFSHTFHTGCAATERILKSSISILDAFNDVRNNKSLTHDNPVLNRNESLLIFQHVTSVIRFVWTLDQSIP